MEKLIILNNCGKIEYPNVRSGLSQQSEIETMLNLKEDKKVKVFDESKMTENELMIYSTVPQLHQSKIKPETSQRNFEIKSMLPHLNH